MCDECAMDDAPYRPQATPRGRPWMTHAMSTLRLPPPSIPHHTEAGAEQEQGGGFGNGDRTVKPLSEHEVDAGG